MLCKEKRFVCSRTSHRTEVKCGKGAEIGIVLEYVDNTDFRTLYPRFTDFDIRYYTREILKGLEFAHGQGIMHRDVRPQNVVIDHQQRKVAISSQQVHRESLTR